jgi:hypothetical protein
MSDKFIPPSPPNRIKDAARALSALTFNEMMEFAHEVAAMLPIGVDETALAGALAAAASEAAENED